MVITIAQSFVLIFVFHNLRLSDFPPQLSRTVHNHGD